MKQMSISKSILHRLSRFSSATLISRVLGYFRDFAVAYVFGGGALTDAFYTAFRISNLFRRFLGEGALSSAFVPIFTEQLKKKGEVETKQFISAFFTSLLVVFIWAYVIGNFLCSNTHTLDCSRVRF